MLFLLLLMISASASLQVLWMSAACISLHKFQGTLRVSACRGQWTWRKVTNLESNAVLGGRYPIPQYRKKNWQIPQYHKKNWQIPQYSVKNRRNTATAFSFGHASLKLYLSRVFVYSKHLCTSNQPQPSRGNVRRPRIDQYNDQKR